jgi:hypothetical protein
MALGLGVVVVVLFAQMDKTGQEGPLPVPEPTGQVSDEQLEAFALIFSEVTAIHGALRAEMLKATSEQAVEDAEQMAQQRMIEAVRRNGLEVEEYNRIARLLNEDSALFERYQEIEKKATGNKGQPE